MTANIATVIGLWKGKPRECIRDGGFRINQIHLSK